MNKFNQKSREACLETEVKSLKDENEQLKVMILRQKDALAKELKEK
jgi:hypothetical protein